MQGRVALQVIKVRLIFFGVSKLSTPEMSYCELLEAEHIHDTVWVLVHRERKLNKLNAPFNLMKFLVSFISAHPTCGIAAPNNSGC
jgi:hypothetical protein